MGNMQPDQQQAQQKFGSDVDEGDEEGEQDYFQMSKKLDTLPPHGSTMAPADLDDDQVASVDPLVHHLAPCSLPQKSHAYDEDEDLNI